MEKNFKAKELARYYKKLNRWEQQKFEKMYLSQLPDLWLKIKGELGRD